MFIQKGSSKLSATLLALILGASVFMAGQVWAAKYVTAPATGKTRAKRDSPGNGIVAWANQETGRETGAHGLEWKDGKIYVAAPPSQLIHVIDVATWTEVNAFCAPGLRVHGLAGADDGTLWVADTSAGTVSRLDTEDGRVWEVIRVEAPVEIHGLTIHQGVLWYCDAATCGIGQLYLD